MKKVLKEVNKKTISERVTKNVKQSSLNVEISKRLEYASKHKSEDIFKELNTNEFGLFSTDVEDKRKEYGINIIKSKRKKSVFKRICEAFINPFTAILFLLAVISVFTDNVFAESSEKNPATVIIILVMVIISGFLRFIQDTRSGNAASKLAKMVNTTVSVERDNKLKEIPLEELVVGDIVHLSAGDMIPADIRIIKSKDLFISQSALTGESAPVEKISDEISEKKSITECENLAFMGSNVISGSGIGVVLSVGNDTIFGNLAKSLSGKSPKTSFEIGIGKVSWLLIRFMLVMVPIVLFINGFTKGDWLEALLFAVSVAVGLTPEMLPMIVTAALAKGSVAMSKKKVIVKNLNAIQNLGAMDILCTDKTGTLTQDKVILERHMNIHGDDDDRVLRHAWLNSYYQTGLKNLIDIAVIEKFNDIFGNTLNGNFSKTDEIPFDFERRRMSVIITDVKGKSQLITKGAVEEMLKCCSFAEYNGKVEPITDQLREFILNKADELNAGGMRVIAVAQKNVTGIPGVFSVSDECDMVLIGYLAFLDPPKSTTAAAIKSLQEFGVDVKILTGDNEKVTVSICKQVGLKVTEVLLGSEIDNLTDDELTSKAERITVFAKLSPAQKARVIRVLRSNKHTVGYMGDGINDALAMKESDVGISVDTAVDIAKESADIILLEKDLTILKDGIIEGRKIYANMIKYIKMTASSNFGNMFSVLVASAFLPFIPMAAIQLVLLNLIYDISCIAIPWDNVDSEFLKIPRAWESKSIGSFMVWLGPVSSIFDITTYLIMFFVICPLACGGTFHALSAGMQTQFISVFQAGWFIESMWSQTLVIHMIRTPHIPFIQSRASLPITLLTFAGIAIATIIPFTSLGTILGLSAVPVIYFLVLAVTIIAYMLLATLVKVLYVKRYKELL